MMIDKAALERNKIFVEAMRKSVPSGMTTPRLWKFHGRWYAGLSIARANGETPKEAYAALSRLFGGDFSLANKC